MVLDVVLGAAGGETTVLEERELGDVVEVEGVARICDILVLGVARVAFFIGMMHLAL